MSDKGHSGRGMLSMHVCKHDIEGDIMSQDINARLRKINAKMISIAKRMGCYGYVKLLRKENRTTFKGEFRL